MGRPAAREIMARAVLDTSQCRDAGEERWRVFWDAEIAGLPFYREFWFWLVGGLLLAIWERLTDESVRVCRLVADEGEDLIGRVLGPAGMSEFWGAFCLDGGLGLAAAETRPSG